MATKTETKTPAISAECHTKWVSGLADNSVSVELTFSDGRAIIVSAGDLSDDVQRMALAHGLKQKLVDAAAMSCGPNGRPATIGDKFNAVNEVYQRLLIGEWNKAREGQSTGGLLVHALMEMTGKTRDQIVAFLDGKTAKEQAALRANPKVAPIIERMRAERAGSDAIDSDELLAGLED
jgi:hypothetical protein